MGKEFIIEKASTGRNVHSQIQNTWLDSDWAEESYVWVN